MANLTESPIYEPGIFQLEKSTPPLGGAPVIDNGVPSAGHANAQGLQLANRTAYLKQETDSLDTRTTAVEQSTTDLDTRVDSAETDINNLQAQVTASGSAVTLRSDLQSSSDPAKGSGQIGFSQSLSYPAGSLGKKSIGILNITDAPFNAPSSGEATSAFQAAYDFALDGTEIIVPGPGPYVVGALTGTKNVTWKVLFDINTNLALLNLPGRVVGGFSSSGIIRKNIGTSNDFSNLRLDRIANYSGGSSANVCSNIRATTSVTNNAAASFEWTGTFIMDNAGQGENVALYGQGNRRANSAVTLGGTFGGVLEAHDYTSESNPTTGLISLELDTFANGGDSVGRRVSLDIVVGKGVSSGATCEALAAIRIGPQAGLASNGRYKNGFLMSGDKDYGINITGATVENVIDLSPTSSKIGIKIGGLSSDAGYVHDGTAPYGMRFSGTYANAAIRMPQNVGIAFESTGAIQVKYNSGAMQMLNTGVLRTSFSMSTGAISVGANQVVGPRVVGWVADTGTAKRTASATFLQTAPAAYSQSSMQAVNDALASATQTIKALKDDLITHGLIGA